MAMMKTMVCAPPPPPLSRSRPPAAAPEREAQEEVGEDRDGPDHDAHDEREPDVEVAHVRELVRDDALQLLAVELLEQPGRDRDRRMLRVAAGRERVGRRVLDQVDARHRHVGRDGHLAHDVHQLRGGGLIDLSRAADRQHERVAREVRPDPGQASEEHRADGHGDPTGRFAGHGEADREPKESQQDDDERRHEERVPPIGGDLVVERAGHGASRGRRVRSG